uniref:Vesicle transport protein n=2 Tax=Pseudo-nitzschia australis TaxID=44445 RepID=A0A7S4ADK8_9STRA|mmetsp:Transcript_13421/g.28124  ORF Transcript_13421/g.28124 Transcript_13421/m.28124 type:complete len:232 (+) Transcript_13421:128-823(+)
MSSFGNWYDEKKAAENGDASSNSSSWFSIDTDEVLPLFNSENLQGFSFENMKQSMEGQMPKKIMGMGYQQRFQVFCALLFLSAIFFGLAFFVGVPMLALKPQKFALSFTCGSITFMGSFGIMKGPYEHFISMCTMERMPFTTIYLGSMMATLYLTCTKGGMKGYTLVLISSGVQLVALLWYLVSFLPGGTMGLHMVGRAMCTMLKPVFAACFRLQTICITTCVKYFARSSS